MMEAPDRVLIVDDSPDVIQLLHIVMRELCECMFATNGKAALALARSGRPSVILLDVEMPGMNGFEVLARLKADPDTSDIPVVFVTSSCNPEAEVAAIEAGAADFITKPIVAAVARARVAMQLKLHRQARALAHLAAHDGLTGLFNRRHFDHMLAVEVARHFRHRESLALAIVDVDYFKPYNDHYGHPQGDECLRAVASILAECSQRAGDVLARYGGEEFAIIMPHVVPEQAELLGERLCAAVRERQIPHAGCARGQVTISVGISAGVPAANEPAICLLQADRAVYEAKHGGRDGWRLAPGKMGAMP